MSRLSVATFAAVALSLGVAGAQSPDLTTYALPEEVSYPEGVAYDATGNALFVGSADTGAIGRVAMSDGRTSLLAGAGTIWKADPFPGMLGMKVDAAGRLWIAGGRTGRVAVVDVRSGTILKQFETPAEPAGLLNDVAIAGPNAYITDTFRPTLWRVTTARGQVGELEPWLDFTGTPLKYAEGPNLNGIAATPDGRALIVVQMNTGLLFRIDIGDRKVTPIPLRGDTVPTADGLVLDGRTLYVVRQGEQEIVTVALAGNLRSGRVVNRFRNPALQWPATAAKVGDRLIVVSTQFNRRDGGEPERPFSLVSVPVSMLKGS
jgi:Cu-Zn family superoxide dismutase